MPILLSEDLIQTNIALTTQEDIFVKLSEPLVKLRLVKDSFLDGVISRERKFPTGLPTEPFGVAIPHTDPEHVLKNAISVGVLKSPVKFIIMGTDDESVDVRLIFLLALNESQKQLNILKNITEIIRDEKRLKNWLTLSKTEILTELQEAFQKKGAV